MEWDEVVANLAKNEFGINASFGVDVILNDVLTYVAECNEKYGLVI